VAKGKELPSCEGVEGVYKTQRCKAADRKYVKVERKGAVRDGIAPVSQV
jgi:hypothetical protein